MSILRAVDKSLYNILTRMKELAKRLPEYSTVRSMGGVGDVLAPRLIAEIGDVRRFHNAKALTAYAGIDPPPYESGQFIGTNRKITKRGSATLRKVGYEVMRVLKTHGEPKDCAVYQYILEKESEGKNKKLAKIAGLNKFLRIYYARVTKSVKAIAKATMPESKNYYIDGDRYENQGKTYTFRVLEDDMLFESADGEKVFVVPEYLGTFLPDIASEDRAFSKVPLMQTLSHLTLRELLETANMNDVHLTHSEEEIDLATVVELHKNTLTEEGKREWADVLDAKVERIYDGAYGTQLECSGISPTRLSEFSFMLSGECPAKDFDKWVNDNDSQEQKMDM